MSLPTLPTALKVLLGLTLSLLLISTSLSSPPTLQKTEIWIDVRTNTEHAKDSIKGDVNIPHAFIEDEIEYYVPDKSSPLKVYCTLGKRAQKATKKLIDLGYTNVECIGSIERARSLRGLSK